jgi:hypothetical protein
LRKKKTDKRTQRRVLRREKLQQKAEEEKLPWDERKERLKKRKQKEKLHKRVKYSAVIAVVILLAITVVAVANSITKTGDNRMFGPGGQREPPGGRSFDFSEWKVSGNVTVPEGNPGLTGLVIEEAGDYSFVVQTVRRDSEGTEESILIEEDANIFRLERKEQTLIEANIDAVQVDSMLIMWGEKQVDETWVVTDVGIMAGR